jgi:hypothetical protein
MTLPRADGDLPIVRPERKLVGQFVDSRPINTFGEQFEDGVPDTAADDSGSGERSTTRAAKPPTGRHFEILLNLTFGRAPPSKGLPSKVESGGLELLLPADRWRSDNHRRPLSVSTE